MKNIAVFTFMHQEEKFTKLFVDYYSQFVPKENIYILDHVFTSDEVSPYVQNLGVNVERIIHNKWCDHGFMRKTVQDRYAQLVEQYDYVIFAECDEFLYHPDGLDKYINGLTMPFARAMGIDIIHVKNEEPDLDWSSRPLLMQRNFMCVNPIYNKTLIASCPLKFSEGFHGAICGNINLQARTDLYVDKNLKLFHLHNIDYKYLAEKAKTKEQWEATFPSPDGYGAGRQNRTGNMEELEKRMYHNIHEFIPIPDEYKRVV